MLLSWLKSVLAAVLPVADVPEYGGDPLPPIPK